MNKLSRFLKLLVISVVFSVVSLWGNITKAEEPIGVIQVEGLCYSYKNFNEYLQSITVLTSNITSVQGKVMQNMLVGTEKGNVAVLKVVPDEFWCVLVVFPKKNKT